MTSTKAADKLSESAQTTPSPSAAAQQSDNVAHALAGAGGGLLSMALTSVAFNHAVLRPSNQRQANA